MINKIEDIRLQMNAIAMFQHDHNELEVHRHECKTLLFHVVIIAIVVLVVQRGNENEIKCSIRY
jgi:hypothetical protein